MDHPFTQIIYAGNDTVCQHGAIGTHTRGVVKAFSKIEGVTDITVIGGGLKCFGEQSGIRTSEVGAPLPGSSAGKIWYYRRFADRIASVIERSVGPDDHALIYH